MNDRCVVCGKVLASGTGRWQEGRALYSRIGDGMVRVGAACETHYRDKPGAPRLDLGTEAARAPVIAGLLADALEERFPFGRESWEQDVRKVLGKAGTEP